MVGLLFRSNLENIPDTLEEDESESRSLSSSHSDWKSLGNYLRISLPNNQSTVIALQKEMTADDVVLNTCEKRQLEPRAYFLKLGIQEGDGTSGIRHVPLLWVMFPCMVQNLRKNRVIFPFIWTSYVAFPVFSLTSVPQDTHPAILQSLPRTIRSIPNTSYLLFEHFRILYTKARCFTRGSGRQPQGARPNIIIWILASTCLSI